MNNKQLILLLKELQWLLQSGVHLLAALKLLAQQSALKPSQAIIQNCAHAIGQGQSFSMSLQHVTDNVSALFIRCGEASGELDKSLGHLCHYMQTLQLFYKAIKQALFYPALVFFSSSFLLVFMLLYIVPQFDALYQQFQAPLPASTQWLLDVTAAAPRWLAITAIFLLSVTALLVSLWRHSYNTRLQLEHLLLHTPMLGRVLRYYQHGKFCRLLHLLLAAGIPLTQAIQLLQETNESRLLQKALQEAQHAILQGQSLQYALSRTSYFETYLRDLVALAEQSGKLDYILEQLANYYAEQLKTQLDTFKQMLQPIMILFLGLLLGIWLLLLYYPLLQLGYAI